ncbi:MAG: hypothetical protein IAI50_20960 [Candidatus Eremiobacteraeota bacterium]|nr:hypothetical protein [Candidatus Eremiobacteraeota bacterium]
MTTPLEAQVTRAGDGPSLESLAGVRLGAPGEAAFAKIADEYRRDHPEVERTPLPELRDKFGMLISNNPMPTTPPSDAPFVSTEPCGPEQRKCVISFSATVGAARVYVDTANRNAVGKPRPNAPVTIVSVQQPVDDTNREAVRAFLRAAIARFGQPTIQIPAHRGSFQDDHIFENALVGVAGSSMYFPPTVESKMYAEAAIWCIGGTPAQCKVGRGNTIERRLTVEFDVGTSFVVLQDFAQMRRDLAEKHRAEASALRPQL